MSKDFNDWLAQAEQQELDDLAQASMSPLWLEAVAFLRRELTQDVQAQIRQLIASKSSDWPAGYHMFWGMGIRNLLREHGYGEQEFGIANLDNVYVPLIEAAVENS